MFLNVTTKFYLAVKIIALLLCHHFAKTFLRDKIVAPFLKLCDLFRRVASFLNLPPLPLQAIVLSITEKVTQFCRLFSIDFFLWLYLWI